jgi:ABC-2 type transport system permease protein
VYMPDAGSIAVRGRVVPLIELGAGFSAELSGRDNAVVNGVLLGLSRREARRRSDEALGFAELADFADERLKNYSSGMAVRLAVAVALQVDGDVLLVDEALGVGDAGFREKCFVEFERLKREGKTVILVSHDLSLVERLCDRALLLHDGEVAVAGTPSDVAAAYEAVNAGEPAPRLGAREARPASARHARTPAGGGGLRRFAAVTAELARQEIRLDYTGSVLGMVWALLRPLALFGVLYVLLAHVAHFGAGVRDYPVYLLTAIVLWTFFADATGAGVTCLVHRSALLRTLPVPLLAVPLATVVEAVFALAANLVVLAAFALLSGLRPRVAWLELPALVALLGLLALACTLALAPLHVRYRDVGKLWDVVLRVLFYGSAVLYVAQRFPASVRRPLAMNPIAAILTEARRALVDPTAPGAAASVGGAPWLLVPFAVGGAIAVAGWWIFRREAPWVPENV